MLTTARLSISLAGREAAKCIGSDDEKEDNEAAHRSKLPRIETTSGTARDSLATECQRPANVTARIDSIRYSYQADGSRTDLVDVCFRQSTRNGYPGNAFYIECDSDGEELTFRARCAAGCEPIKLITYGRCAPCKNFLAHRSQRYSDST